MVGPDGQYDSTMEDVSAPSLLCSLAHAGFLNFSGCAWNSMDQLRIGFHSPAAKKDFLLVTLQAAF